MHHHTVNDPLIVALPCRQNYTTDMKEYLFTN